MNMSVDVDVGGFLNQSGPYDYGDYEYKDDLELKRKEALWIPLLYAVVMILGLLGNVFLLVVLTLKRRHWSISDTFILHLAVADILLLLTLPLWAAQAARQAGWLFGSPLCKISGAVFNINFYCGNFLLACMSLDRCLSTVYKKQLFHEKPKLVHIVCLLVWFISILLTIPDWMFLTGVYGEAEEKTLCGHAYSQSVTDSKLFSRLPHLTLGFLLPAAIVIVCYSCILLQRRSESVQKQRAITAMLPMVVVFFLCWIPYNITLFVDTNRKSSKNSLSGFPEGSLKTALMATTALACVHACLRPLIYFSLCGNFRNRTLALVQCSSDKWKSKSLWELGIGEETPPELSQTGEELQQMKTQVQSNDSC